LVSLRLDRIVIDAFKAAGPGWQSRINAALKKRSEVAERRSRTRSPFSGRRTRSPKAGAAFATIEDRPRRRRTRPNSNWPAASPERLSASRPIASPAIVPRSARCFREAFMQTVAFKAGDTIIAEGDEGDTAFFIVTGSVEVAVGQGDKSRTIGMLNGGEVFGEMSLIEPGPRSATVTAATDVECLATSYAEFIEAIEDHPDRAVAFMKTLVRRL